MVLLQHRIFHAQVIEGGFFVVAGKKKPTTVVGF